MVGEPLGPPFSDDVEIGVVEKLLVEPEKLPYPPLYAVAHHRDTHFPADGDTQSSMPALTCPPDDNKMSRAYLFSGFGQKQIIASLPDPFTTGKGGIHIIYLQAICTDNFLRPFARLRFITSRPFLVAIRTRKPWVLLREMLLG